MVFLLHACPVFTLVKIGVGLQHNYYRLTNLALQLPPELHVLIQWQNMASINHNLLFPLVIKCLGKAQTWFRAKSVLAILALADLPVDWAEEVTVTVTPSPRAKLLTELIPFRYQ